LFGWAPNTRKEWRECCSALRVHLPPLRHGEHHQSRCWHPCHLAAVDLLHSRQQVRHRSIVGPRCLGSAGGASARVTMTVGQQALRTAYRLGAAVAVARGIRRRQCRPGSFTLSAGLANGSGRVCRTEEISRTRVQAAVVMLAAVRVVVQVVGEVAAAEATTMETRRRCTTTT
jgi:hypothetical protein